MRFSRFFFLLFCAIAIFPLASTSYAAGPGTHHLIQVFSDDTVSLITDLERSGYDVAGINRREGYVEVIVDAEELEILRAQGFEIRVKESYIGGTTTAVPPGYRHYNDLAASLNFTQMNYPQIVQVLDLGAETGVGTTYEGRKLLAVKISDNVKDDENEPNVYIVGCHHAREIMTPEFCLWAIDKLTTLYGVDEDVTRWVNTNQIYICPIANPDGHVYCFDVYDYWRKNRFPSGGGDYGVDLNRNFDFNWYGPHSGSTDPGSDTYKGSEPNSEQETKIEVAFAEERHLAKVLDFHSYGSEVLYTYYEASSFPSLLENWFEDRARDMSIAFDYNGWIRKASAEGEHYQWELNKFGGFSFLVETGDDFQPSYADAQAEFDNHIWPGIQWFLDHEICLRGHVTEAVTGNPIQANITVKGINYTMDEIRQSEPQFGKFHYYLPPGTHEVTIAAFGHGSKTVEVDIEAGKSTLLEVQLGNGPKLTVNGPAMQNERLDLDFDWSGGPGQYYMNGISLGTDGFTFKNGVHVPLDLDVLYRATVGAFPGWKGYLDASGHAEAQLPVPREPLVVGLTVYMGFFVMDAATKKPLISSSAVNITIDA